MHHSHKHHTGRHQHQPWAQHQRTSFRSKLRRRKGRHHRRILHRGRHHSHKLHKLHTGRHQHQPWARHQQTSFRSKLHRCKGRHHRRILHRGNHHSRKHR